MRRFIPPVMVGLGVFLLLAAALIKFYAYPKLAVAPIDQDSVTNLEASDAVVFDTDPSLLTEVRTDLTVATTTRGDVEASEAATEESGTETRVWAGTTTIVDSEGKVLSQGADRTAFDARTAEAVDCCDGFVEDEADVRVPVTREGLVYKFPFDTEQKTYAWWDDTAQATVDMEFVEETEIDGLAVYQFRGELPAGVVGTRSVPALIVGEQGTEDVEADVSYANTRTFWVEPQTGAIIDRREEQRSTLQVGGEDRVTTTEADLSYTDAQVAANVEEFQSKASVLGLANGLAVWLVALVGLLLAVGGVLLSRRGGSGPAAAAPAPTSGSRPRTPATV